MDKKEIAQAVGHIPSGLFIVTTADGDKKDGYLASWVQQVSFEPLLISVAINEGRPGYEAIKSGKIFTLNVVGEHEMGYLRHFWKGYEPGKGPFDNNDVEHRITEAGGLIINNAKSAIECRMKESIKPGDHEIIIAEVVASHSLKEDSSVKVHTRKSGLDY